MFTSSLSLSGTLSPIVTSGTNGWHLKQAYTPSLPVSNNCCNKQFIYLANIIIIKKIIKTNKL